MGVGVVSEYLDDGEGGAGTPLDLSRICSLAGQSSLDLGFPVCEKWTLKGPTSKESSKCIIHSQKTLSKHLLDSSLP